MKKNAAYWINQLNLQKHPEGGWYKEIYRSKESFPAFLLHKDFNGTRDFSTSIYYLLEKDNFSAFHRIKSDELWHFYTGSSGVEIVTIENGTLLHYFLGNNPEKGECFQVIIPKNTWFAARLINRKGFALTGCTVSPGFHFDDFELATDKLLEDFPLYKIELKDFLRFF
jgi:uncharacterized protein